MKFTKYLFKLHKNNPKEFERLTLIGHKRNFNKLKKEESC